MTPRSAYERQLAQLDEELEDLALLVEAALGKAVETAHGGEILNPHLLEETESDIGSASRDVETLCLRLFLRQQPLARDLRDVSGALKVVTDLERIGDMAIDACRIMQQLGTRAYGTQADALARIATSSERMAHRAICSYLERDIDKASGVAICDDEVDSLLLEIQTELIADIIRERIDAGLAVDLLMIAKYFERIADHAVNVAGWTEYLVEGTLQGKPYEADGVH